MLDIKSNLVLKILQKECRSSGYKIVDKSDIISSLPAKYRVDEEGLDHIITFLERCECVHVKYDDDSVYCLCILPRGNQITESDEKNKNKQPKLWLFVIFSSIFALIGGFLGGIISNFIKF